MGVACRDETLRHQWHTAGTVKVQRDVASPRLEVGQQRSTRADRVEVVKSVQRRRRWSLSEKLQAVEEAAAPEMKVS